LRCQTRTLDEERIVQTRYIGLDLAWSERNLSGAATLAGGPEGAALIEPPALLGDLDAIVAYVARAAADGPALVAVDAPLLVPNAAGRRPAEAQLAAVFQAYEAGAHPANRRLLDRDGRGVRGELLVARLEALGFRSVAGINAGAPGRLVTEVYPHAAMVGIFGLARTLKYKARPGRGDAERAAAWRRYQELLGGLAEGDPPLRGQEELLAIDTAALRGRALKAYEDRVDSLTCAYIALYAHRWGARRCRVFGDMASGTIFTPVPESLW
jgi:predicted RNase H-like nuclease